MDVTGKAILARVDYNVPLDSSDGARVTDDSRIRASLPTLEYLREHDARLVLVSHLGRPNGDPDERFSMAPVSSRLAELTGADVRQAPAVVGPEVDAAARELEPRSMLMLENSRFEPGETKNDPDLVAKLAHLGEIYVNDAFGSSHRAHATTEGIAHVLPGVAGFLLEREVTMLTQLLESPERPFVVLLGGAKVTDKIGVIERFLEIADAILIGGAMCFSFFRAMGEPTGDSLVEEEGVEEAKRVLSLARDSSCRLELPVDLVIARELSAGAPNQETDGTAVPDGWMGLDVGPRTRAAYEREIAGARTVFWNGPMGAFEVEPFAAGTERIARAVAAASATTVVGGGDSVAALQRYGLTEAITHVSTGGGASLELLEGTPLPGVEALQDAGS